MSIPTLTLELALNMLEDAKVELGLAKIALTTKLVTPAHKAKLTKLLQERDMLQNWVDKELRNLVQSLNGLYVYAGNSYQNVTAALKPFMAWFTN